jgi:hypothetical protein
MHAVFAILTVFTCGFFSIIWLIVAATSRERRAYIAVDPSGNVIFNGHQGTVVDPVAKGPTAPGTSNKSYLNKVQSKLPLPYLKTDNDGRITRKSAFVLVSTILGVMVLVWIVVAIWPSSSSPAQDQHSAIAAVALPPQATLKSTPATNGLQENWYANASEDDAIKQMKARLPVNKPMGDLPWCGHGPSTSSWLWGRPNDYRVYVKVFTPWGKDQVEIEIVAGPPSPGDCAGPPKLVSD